jgi:predicted DCC family thiol-disulfide oxidoreductase YuxK
MKSLTVFYDETCSLCLRCRDWLVGEPQIVPLVFVQKSLLAISHPSLSKYTGGSDLVAVNDEGDVWIGDAAFLTILFSLENYRRWGTRLSGPSLRPCARRFFSRCCRTTAARISMLLGGAKDDVRLEQFLADQPHPSCDDGKCQPEGRTR